MSKNVNNIGNRASITKAVKDVDAAYFQKVWNFSNAIKNLDRGRVKTPQEMEIRIQELFDVCSNMGMMPTYESIAVACRYSY